MRLSRALLNGREVSLISDGKKYFAIDDRDYFNPEEAFKKGKPVEPVNAWTSLIPVPSVPSIRDFYTFEEHVRKARARRGLSVPSEWYEIPAYYYSCTSMLFPSGEKVPYPDFTKELDYEMEVGIVIGKEGMNIRKENAFSHVLGLVLANDWSARDLQRKEMSVGLGPSKSKDFATSIGPYVVTLDEISDRILPDGKIDLDVEAYVNGVKYSSGNLSDMRWSFQELVEYASRSTILRKGDILLSGTISSGCILELGPENFGWLKRGDVVSLRGGVLGTLENEVS
jgi:fumarylacetoacetate (FAA) hydrolase